jgi:hypothetical protein
VNRFKNVVQHFQMTSHVEEALHRLTESYLALGIVPEAQTAAAVLGHNFPDSQWYQDSLRAPQQGRLQARGEQRLLDVSGLPPRRQRLIPSPAMLASLTIQDIVLIDRLGIDFDRGLTVLTGETGAGQVHSCSTRCRSLSARAAIPPLSGRRRAGPDHGGLRATAAGPRRRIAASRHSNISGDGPIVLRRTQGSGRQDSRLRQRSALQPHAAPADRGDPGRNPWPA